MPPTKAEQVAEATAREQAGINPGDSAQALNTIEGEGATAQAARAPERPQPLDERSRPPAPPPFVSKREEIVARYKRDRAEQAAAEREETQEFMRSGMPPEFDAMREPQPQAEPQPEPQPQPVEAGAPPAGLPENARAAPTEAQPPKTVKVKVNGEIREIPYEDLVANAQIALASKDILEEAKALRKDWLDTRNSVARTDQGQHQPQPSAQPQPQPGQEDAPNQEPDPYARLAELAQFGDPTEFATAMRDTIAREIATGVAAAVPHAIQAQDLRREGMQAARVLNEFTAQHAELAQDPYFRAAVETRMYQLQVDDIRALGIDPSTQRNPQTDQPWTPGDVARAHAWYRSQGYATRTPDQMLRTATDDIIKWKGVTSQPPTDANANANAGAPVNGAAQAAANGAAPSRLEVSVDRSQRRQGIPQQPDRAAAPRTSAQQQPPQPRDRSAIVAEEIRRRQTKRGIVAAN